MASPFLDWVEEAGSWVPGGSRALPAWLAGLTTKRNNPGATLDAAIPYYQALAGNAQFSQDAAMRDAAMREGEWRPRAVKFADDAQYAGSPAALAEAADRNGANFRAAYTAQKTGLDRTMKGVNPNSGAAGAAQGALRASYAPGLVDAMNKGRREERKYGDALNSAAIEKLNVAPNFGQSGALFAGAARGASDLAKASTDDYRQRVADSTKAFKLPFDLQDEQDRRTRADRQYNDQLEIMRRWMSGRMPNTNYDSAGTFTPEFSGYDIAGGPAYG